MFDHIWNSTRCFYYLKNSYKKAHYKIFLQINNFFSALIEEIITKLSWILKYIYLFSSISNLLILEYMKYKKII